jgi:signal transduction histidine kinase/ABC-type amino acid transport substrate-binding protein
MRRKIGKLSSTLAVVFFLAVFSGCGKVQTVETGGVVSPFTTFREIPEVTKEEIAAIEELQKKYQSLSYAMSMSTEAFLKGNGELGGYGALLCEWMSGLFDIRFKLETHASDELLLKLRAGEIDFMGNMRVTEERMSAFHMTDTIVDRQYKRMRLAGSRDLYEISMERPVRYSFMEGFTIIETVDMIMESGNYEALWVKDFEEAYRALENETADAFIGVGAVEEGLAAFGNIYSEDFFPLVFSSASIAASNSEFKPIISVITKAQRNGARPYLIHLLNQGNHDYLKHKLSTLLSDEEKAYIANRPVIPFVANYNNYPVCFYNHRDKQWQGIFFDLMDEVSSLTGLSFDLVNDEKTEWPVIYEKLLNGEAALSASLVRTQEREDYFIWSKTAMPPDYYALISKSDYRDLTVNEIMVAKVGLAKDTVYETIFREWFPNHANIVEYNSLEEALSALQRGNVELVMATQRRLLLLTHFNELPGYKTNIVFNQPIETIFGYNSDEDVLCSIIDKALQLIDTNTIADHWMRMTFDYRAKVAEAQIPWLIGVVFLFLVLMILMSFMFRRMRFEGKRLKGVVDRRTEELNRQNLLMSAVNAAAAILLEPDTGLGAISRSIEMISQNADIDRVYLWQSIRKDNGKMYYRLLCNWARPAFKTEDDVLEFAYDDTLAVWKILFSNNNTLNGPMDSLPEIARDFFNSYQLKSILVLPLFLKGEMWGFVSFEDCHNRRFFPKADEYALRSWGLLVVSAVQRYEIMGDLRAAIIEARNASTAKTRFIANMSHEMRTPMNVIIGLTDLMMEENVITDEIKNTLKKINTAGNTLTDLINDVLDISKIEAGKFELIPVQYDVASFLNDIITLNSIRIGDKQITFILDISEDLPSTLFGDDIRVKQILNNLLSNAFKYTKEGTVTLGVSCWRDKVTSENDDIWVYFYVRDTGIGIRKDDMVKLFTDYNQVNPHANRTIEGTGLGLSITKKFIELMNGKISVESEYGKGSTFSVRIRQKFVTDRPIGRETAESLRSFQYSDKSKLAHEKIARADLSYARVLVVDDFSTNLEVAAGMLRKYKMGVDCVTSGQEAIDLISAGKPVYDAIFMDHMMPGLDGIQTTIVIRTLNTEYSHNIPIIALTANAIAGNEQMFLENGFDAYLPKPFSVANLDSIVQRWVRDKSKE